MVDIRNVQGLKFIIAQWRHLTENFKGGGHLSMHNLAYKLAERGQNVYICCEPYFKHENINVLPCESYIDKDGNDVYTMPKVVFNYNDTVTVYTQITKGNPFNTINNNRWIMYDTEKVIEDTYGIDDVYFNWNNFKTFNKNREVGKLTLHNFNKEKMYNKNMKRSGYCHILHKNLPNNFEHTFNLFNSTDLTNWRHNGGLEYLMEEFNKHEYYLTFDDKSYFSIAAVMCGCKTIIIPNNENKKKYLNAYDFRMKNYDQNVGISYGFDDLPWSENTIQFINGHIDTLDSINNKTVDSFIDFWKKKLNNG